MVLLAVTAGFYIFKRIKKIPARKPHAAVRFLPLASYFLFRFAGMGESNTAVIFSLVFLVIMLWVDYDWSTDSEQEKLPDVNPQFPDVYDERMLSRLTQAAGENKTIPKTTVPTDGRCSSFIHSACRHSFSCTGAGTGRPDVPHGYGSV